VQCDLSKIIDGYFKSIDKNAHAFVIELCEKMVFIFHENQKLMLVFLLENVCPKIYCKGDCVVYMLGGCLHIWINSALLELWCQMVGGCDEGF